MAVAYVPDDGLSLVVCIHGKLDAFHVYVCVVGDVHRLLLFSCDDVDDDEDDDVDDLAKMFSTLWLAKDDVDEIVCVEEFCGGGDAGATGLQSMSVVV